jgi:hypothetical protein
MLEFTTVSASSYDPPALAAKLTALSAEGWDVVSVISTGGDITAFLSRAASGASPAADTPAAEAAPAAVAEPAGWAVAPEPAPAAQPEPTPAAQPEPTPVAAAAAAAPATPAVPANWYADPSGRFELRYWDGNAWTEHVSRAGQQYTDPPVA